MVSAVKSGKSPEKCIMTGVCVCVVDIVRVPLSNPSELYSTKKTFNISSYERNYANSTGDVIELWFQRSNLASQGTSDDVWKHYWLSQQG